MRRAACEHDFDTTQTPNRRALSPLWKTRKPLLVLGHTSSTQQTATDKTTSRALHRASAETVDRAPLEFGVIPCRATHEALAHGVQKIFEKNPKNFPKIGRDG
jgi:hypothetical protein